MTFVVIDKRTDPAARLRTEWASLLKEHMECQGVTRKELRRRLEALDFEITEQAIGYWLRGTTAPKPHHQAALAKALNVPHRSLFPAPTVGEVA